MTGRGRTVRWPRLAAPSHRAPRLLAHAPARHTGRPRGRVRAARVHRGLPGRALHRRGHDLRDPRARTPLGNQRAGAREPISARLRHRQARVRGARHSHAGDLRARRQQRSGRGAGLRRSLRPGAIDEVDRDVPRRRTGVYDRQGARPHRLGPHALFLVAQRQRQREPIDRVRLRPLASTLHLHVRQSRIALLRLARRGHARDQRRELSRVRARDRSRDLRAADGGDQLRFGPALGGLARQRALRHDAHRLAARVSRFSVIRAGQGDLRSRCRVRTARARRSRHRHGTGARLRRVVEALRGF